MQEKLEVTRQLEEKIGHEEFQLRCLELGKRMKSDTYNPKKSGALYFKEQLQKAPGEGRNIRKLAHFEPTIMASVHGGVKYSSHTKEKGILELKEELRQRGVSFEEREKITDLKKILKDHEEKRFLKFLQAEVQVIVGSDPGNQGISQMKALLKETANKKDGVCWKCLWDFDLKTYYRRQSSGEYGGRG